MNNFKERVDKANTLFLQEIFKELENLALTSLLRQLGEIVRHLTNPDPHKFALGTRSIGEQVHSVVALLEFVCDEQSLEDQRPL